MSTGALVATVVLLLANGFFVAVEFALVASRRSRLEAMADSGRRGARRAIGSISDLSIQLAGAQLGITIASLLLGFVAEPAIAGTLEVFLHDQVSIPESVAVPLGFTIGLSIVVFLHMVVGEMVPKSIAISDPERALLVLDLPNRGYLAVFRPVIHVLNAMSVGLLRLIGIRAADEISETHTSDELADIVAESREEGLIEEISDRLLRGALAIGGAPIGPMTVPRSRIAYVERSATPIDVEDTVVRTGHTRLLVVGDGGLDDVLGFVHAKDLLSIPGTQRDRQLPLGRIRRLPIVSADAMVDDVLLALQKARVHLALVTEDGGRTTAGIVSLEDVLEELVGEITDESDRP